MNTRPTSLLLALFLTALPACSGGSSSTARVDVEPDSVTDAPADSLLDAPADSDATETSVDSDTDAGAPEGGPWYEDAVFYEVFVRSFADSDGDGIGDLRGLIDHLDYLNDGLPGEGDDLEVDALWLMPLFESPSYHGYDTVDYLTVDPAYGTNADLADLFAACEERGMRVILDLVVNHTSSQHPWFVNARTGPGAEYRGYYVWRADDPGWTQPWSDSPVWHRAGDAYYYGLFWSGMPDLNFRNEAVRQTMLDVASHWVRQGAAGYRLDAVRYLVESGGGSGQFEQPETHGYLKAMRATLAAIDPDVYLVGEVWTARSAVDTYFGTGNELQQAFDFDLQLAIEQALEGGSAAPLATALRAVAESAPGWPFEATFADNHDLDRLSRRLPEDWQQRAAATVLLTLPGTPYLYYGDELGMRQGSAPGDEAKRLPMAWDTTAHGGFTTGTPWATLPPDWQTRNVATELGDATSLLEHHRALVALRRAHPELGAGGELALVDTAPDGLFAIVRHDAGGAFLVVVNLTGGELDPGTLDLSGLAEALGAGPWQPALVFGTSAAAPVSTTDLAAVPIGSPLSAGEARVLRLR